MKNVVALRPKEVLWLEVEHEGNVYRWRLVGLTRGAFHTRLESPELADAIVVGPDVQNAVTITPITYQKD